MAASQPLRSERWVPPPRSADRRCRGRNLTLMRSAGICCSCDGASAGSGGRESCSARQLLHTTANCSQDDQMPHEALG